MTIRIQEEFQDLTESYVVRAVDSEKPDIFVGIAGAHPAGMIGRCAEQDMGCGQISNFEVGDNYRGEGGVASPLFERAEQILVRLGFRDAILFVDRDNGHAQAFYERKGWRQDGYADARLLDLRYRKKLTQECG